MTCKYYKIKKKNNKKEKRIYYYCSKQKCEITSTCCRECDYKEEKEKINTIFFEDQIFDAYVLLLDIFDIVKEEIIIIDNYTWKRVIESFKKYR